MYTLSTMAKLMKHCTITRYKKQCSTNAATLMQEDSFAIKIQNPAGRQCKRQTNYGINIDNIILSHFSKSLV